ncbi:LysR family transcriptional regulator [Pseudomonas sp. NPDC087358]|uniref:LysR family transcriptional regulator n=1 Tax=Pseudomonas sp. NPDC087358 TaxID=3364439 RepID=UPI00384CB8DE
MNINERHFANFDMNLTVVFMLLYRERSVSRAAKLLRVGQPAVSGSLVRLRQQFEDPLFTRCGRGVSPTERAEQIVAQLMPALSTIEAILCSKG